MDQVYLWYLGSITASPIILAGVLWLARQDMRRSILVLSTLALGIGVASAIVFTLLLKSLMDSQGVYSAGSISSDSYMNVLVIQEWHSIALDIAVSLQNAAWVLALYSAIQARRGRWLLLIAACATVSSFVEFFAANAAVVGIAAIIPLPLGPFTSLVVAHPFGTLFALNLLALLASGATLLYCQIGLRTENASGLVPGAVVVPATGHGALPDGSLPSLPTGATDTVEDVEFIVERLPSVRSERG